MGIRVTMVLAVVVSLAFLFNSYTTPQLNIQARATSMKKVGVNETRTSELPPTAIAHTPKSPETVAPPEVKTPAPSKAESMPSRYTKEELAKLEAMGRRDESIKSLSPAAAIQTYRNIDGVSFLANVPVVEALSHLHDGRLGHGVMVDNVLPGSPAAKAGLKKADMILEIEGQEVMAYQDIVRALVNKTPGDYVTLLTLSGNSPSTQYVRLEGAPEKEGYRQPVRMGISMDEANGLNLLRQQLGFQGGIWVQSVAAESAAFKCGLKPKDVLIKANGAVVHSTLHLSRALSEGPIVQLVVIREGSEVSLTLEQADKLSP